MKTSKETFSKFQETHASEIARQSTGLRLTPSRIRGAVKSRRRVVDRFGLCLELDRASLLNFAVLSLDLDEEKKKYVQLVVAAPVTSLKSKQRGVSSEDWRLILNAQEAHRQLSLSKHFPNALGMFHRTGIHAHTAFAYVVFEREAREFLNHFTLLCFDYVRRISHTRKKSTLEHSYEYFRVIPIRTVLQRRKLEESSLTFRFWSAQVLRALWDLHTQCSFQVFSEKSLLV